MDPTTQKFPIEIATREVELTLECLLFFYFIESAIMFYIQFKKGKDKFSISDDKAYIFLYFGLSFTSLFRIVGGFYFTNQALIILFLNTSNIIRIISLNTCAFIIEKDKILYRKFFFSKVFLFFTFTYAILIPFYESLYLYAFPVFIVFIIFLGAYLRDLSKKTKILRSDKHQERLYSSGMFGFTLVIIGTVISHESFIYLFGSYARIIGIIILLFGIGSCNHFFKSISSLSEYDWSEHVKKVIISKRSGLCLYERSCDENEKIQEDILLSGALVLIKIQLEYLSTHSGLTVIEKEGDYYLIYPGKHVLCILITDVYLNSLKLLLRSFVEKIEFIYSDLLENWEGGLKIFEPINDMVNEFFFLK